MVRMAPTIASTFSAAKVRQYCQRYFSVERMVADYVALYQTLVAQDSPVGKSSSRITMVA
jgi:hypothetical protein